jgi:uncharacterized Fe-S center protein
MVREDEKCMNCSACLYICTEGVHSLPPKAHEKLQVSLAHAAVGVVSQFTGKVAFINFVQDVTQWCDCAAPSGPPVVPDIGILASTDAVAIDKASLDLIAQTKRLGKFTDIDSPDILGKINNTDSLIQIWTAQELGLGNVNYELKEQK